MTMQGMDVKHGENLVVSSTISTLHQLITLGQTLFIYMLQLVFGIQFCRLACTW